jgi:uncharacterized membrane protein (UPF0136 family)
MSSIFSEKTLGGLSTFRKWLFRCAVGVIIFGVVMGAIQILTVNDLEGAKAFGQTFSTMICVGIMLIFLSVCSKLLESRKAVPQVFAVIGGIFSIIWVIFAVLGIWIPNDAVAGISCSSYYSIDGCQLYTRTIDKISSIAMYMSLFGVLCGAIMNMYEGKRKDTILPLKITASTLLGYELLYFTIVTMIGRISNPRLLALTGFAAVVWFVVWIIALCLSSSEKRKDQVVNTVAVAEEPKVEVKEEPAEKPARKSDEELRAEIEERVRREMIEKEVREEMEAEKKKKK